MVTERRVRFASIGTLCQFSPMSSLWNSAPFAPAAHNSWPLAVPEMLIKSVVIPVADTLQVFPESLDLTILPLDPAPTTVFPSSASNNEKISSDGGPDQTFCQVLPALS